MKRLLFISICILSLKAYSQQTPESSTKDPAASIHYKSCVSIDTLKQIQEMIKASVTKAEFYKHYYKIATLESWREHPELKNYNKNLLFALINKSSKASLNEYDCLERDARTELVQEIDSLFSKLKYKKTEDDEMELDGLLATNMGCSYFSVEPSYVGRNVIQIEGSVGMAGNTFCKYYKISTEKNEVIDLQSKPLNGSFLEQKLKKILTKQFQIGYSSLGSQAKIKSSNSSLFEFTVPVFSQGEDDSSPSYEVKYTAVNEYKGFKLVGKVYLKKSQNDKWILL